MSASLPKRPQLTFDELHQLKWLLGGVLTLIGISTVFYMDVDAWSLMALTTLAAVATLVRPTLPGRVPRWVHTLTFPAIVTFFVCDLWLKSEILPAMVRLDILLLLYRSVTYRQRRDDLQIIVLGLFLIIVAGVLTVSLMFAAQLLIYAGCALALLLVVTLSDAAPGAKSRAVTVIGETPGWAQHANWPHLFRRLREVTDWRVVGLGAVLFAGVVGVSALLFLAIPRFQLENSMFLDRFISKKAKSGFSDTIRFGDVTEIQQDNSLALSVDVSDQAQIPATPYWRMLVLDRYENGTYRFSEQLRRSQFGPERTFAFLHGEAQPRKGAAVYWTFYLESGISRYLPLLGHFEKINFREAQNFQLAPFLAIVRLREDPVTMTAYRVEGFELSNSLRDSAFAQRWAERETQGRQALHLLTGLTRESDIAAASRAVASVTGGEKLGAPEFGRRVSAWLKKNHNYTLSPNIPRGDGDPLVRWMMSNEAGHCELFAGSCVLLARMAGLPARVVTGFRGGSWNGYSNNFTIRNADAHAWTEIFDEDSGAWLRVDPLAAAVSAATEEVKGEAAIVSRLDRSWKARLDSLRVFWYRRIVSFDRQSQADTIKAVKQAKDNFAKYLRESLATGADRVKAWLAAPWDVRRLMTLLGGVAVLALVVWVWREFGRAWWLILAHGRGARREDPMRREAGRWLQKFTRSGNVPPASDPTVLAELQRVRFGARSSWSEPDKLFRRARRALREERRRPPVTPSSP